MARTLTSIVDSARVVDLTHRLSPEFPLFPAYDPIEMAQRFTVERDGFFDQRWTFDEHVGTHVDAPAHFGGDLTVDAIDPSALLAEVVVLDVRERVARDHDAVVVPDDVLAWERRHGPLPDRCVVLALTGWGDRVGDAESYLNVDDAGVMHFPGFGADVAEFLLVERPGVHGLGIDVCSLDRGASAEYPVHTAWLPSGRFGVENIARLDAVPPRGAVIVVGVPPLEGGSAAPARILALVP